MSGAIEELLHKTNGTESLTATVDAGDVTGIALYGLLLIVTIGAAIRHALQGGNKKARTLTYVRSLPFVDLHAHTRSYS